MSTSWYHECQVNTQTVVQHHESHPPTTPVINHKGYLYPWQVTTLQWMADMEGTRETNYPLLKPNTTLKVTSQAPGGLIASAVGTGKTAILVAHILRTATVEAPVLLVVPAQVEQQWVAEFETMGRVQDKTVSVMTRSVKPKKRKRGGDDSYESTDSPFVVWRCNTVVNTRAPPLEWRVLLVTYNFVVRRAEALLNKRFVFDFAKWVEVSKDYAQEHGIATVFHDRVWGAIVYDEINEVITSHHKWIQSYLNSIPAAHVWGLTATPICFQYLAALLRITQPTVTVKKHHEEQGLREEDRTVKYIMNHAQDMWRGAVTSRSIRFSKEIMPHVRVRHRVAVLELSPQEREVMEFMHLTYTSRDDLLFCTDLAAFMANVVRQRSGELSETAPQEESLHYITREEFWTFMESDVQERLAASRRALRTAEDTVAQYEAVLPALDPRSLEALQLTTKLGVERRKCTTLTQTVSSLTRQGEYIGGLKDRIREAETNPCPICMDTIEEGKLAVTPCTHVFCVTCILPWVQAHRKCPMCRAQIFPGEMNVLVNEVPQPEVPPEMATEEQDAPPGEADAPEAPATLNYSTKIRFLLTQLRVLCSQTDDKAIVFCNYNGTARKIQGVLESEGIVCTNLVGNIFSKNKKLKQFRCDDNCRILFLHSGVHYSGMDLFNANHIYFVNSALDSHVVQQAVGRCVRLSQTKDVNVTFLTMTEVETMPDLQVTLGPFYEGSVEN